MIHPVFLFEKTLATSIDISLKNALFAEQASAIGIALVKTPTSTDYLSYELSTPVLNHDGTMRVSDGAGRQWFSAFLRYDDPFQDPLWVCAQTLYEAVKEPELTILCWFFQDKLVAECSDPFNKKLCISIKTSALSNHQKLQKIQEETQRAQDWTYHQNAQRLIETHILGSRLHTTQF